MEHEKVESSQKFADDITVIGFITNGDVTKYYQEGQQLASWFSWNNHKLYSLKTTLMHIDIRKHRKSSPPQSS